MSCCRTYVLGSEVLEAGASGCYCMVANASTILILSTSAILLWKSGITYHFELRSAGTSER